MSIIKDKLKTKDGRQYRFKVYYHDSENKLKPYVSKRFLTMKEAKAEERAFLLNRDIPVKKKIKYIAEAYFKDLKTRVKESTYITYLNTYNYNIKKDFENRYIDEIKVIDIEKWKEKLIKTRLSVSANQIYVVFKEIFKYANRKFELNYNPVVLAGRIKTSINEIKTKNKSLRYITYEEFIKFKNSLNSPLFECFFTTLFFSGMRKGEAQALTWKDINFKNNTILINKTLSFITTNKEKYKITPTKNYLTRTIAMSKTLTKELFEYKEKIKEYSNFKESWFVFGNNEVLKDYKISNARKKAFKDAKINEITTHEFRHSHVSLCINEYLKSGQTDSNKFLLMMSSRMGQTIDKMQKIYLHMFPYVQDKKIDLLDKF